MILVEAIMFGNKKKIYAFLICVITVLFLGITGSIEVKATNQEIILKKTVKHEHTTAG